MLPSHHFSLFYEYSAVAAPEEAIPVDPDADCDMYVFVSLMLCTYSDYRVLFAA